VTFALNSLEPCVSAEETERHRCDWLPMRGYGPATGGWTT